MEARSVGLSLSELSKAQEKEKDVPLCVFVLLFSISALSAISGFLKFVGRRMGIFIHFYSSDLLSHSFSPVSFFHTFLAPTFSVFFFSSFSVYLFLFVLYLGFHTELIISAPTVCFVQQPQTKGWAARFITLSRVQMIFPVGKGVRLD